MPLSTCNASMAGVLLSCCCSRSNNHVARPSFRRSRNTTGRTSDNSMMCTRFVINGIRSMVISTLSALSNRGFLAHTGLANVTWAIVMRGVSRHSPVMLPPIANRLPVELETTFSIGVLSQFQSNAKINATTAATNVTPVTVAMRRRMLHGVATVSFIMSPFFRRSFSFYLTAGQQRSRTHHHL